MRIFNCKILRLQDTVIMEGRVTGTEIHWEKNKHIYLISSLSKGIGWFRNIRSHHPFSNMSRYSCKLMKIANMYWRVNTIITHRCNSILPILQTMRLRKGYIKWLSPHHIVINQQSWDVKTSAPLQSPVLLPCGK